MLVSQDTYPTLPPPPPPTTDPRLVPPWTSNNPYIHTSRPYRLPLVKPVGPDEQYPKSPSSSLRPHHRQDDGSRRPAAAAGGGDAADDDHQRRQLAQHNSQPRHRHPHRPLEELHPPQHDYAAMASLTDYPGDPLYESITSLRFPPGMTTAAAAVVQSQQQQTNLRSRVPENHGEGAVATEASQKPPPSLAPATDRDIPRGTEPVIRSGDSVQDILRKLSGDYAVGRADSPDISRELEYAFLAKTEETNI